MRLFNLKWYQVVTGITLTSLCTLSYDVNGGFSINEIVLTIYHGYGDEKNKSLRYVRLGTMFVGNLLMAVPSAWLGLTVYRNRHLAIHDEHLHPEQIKQTVVQRIQHLLLLCIASIYGFVAALNMVYGFAGLSDDEVHPVFIYSPAIALGFMYAWGFNHLHSHAVQQSSNQAGIFSRTFLVTIKNRFWTQRDKQRTAIALASIGEYYFIIREFFEQLSRNPDLKEHFAANQIWFICVSLIFALFGLIEANTEIAGIEQQAAREEAGTLTNTRISKLAHAAGLMHSIDHATGIVKLMKDIVWLATFNFVSDPNWIDEDNAITCSVRGLVWLLIAVLFLNENAKGFKALILAAHSRYFKAAENEYSPLLDGAHSLVYQTQNRPVS